MARPHCPSSPAASRRWSTLETHTHRPSTSTTGTLSEPTGYLLPLYNVRRRVEDPNDPGTAKTWWFGGGTDLTPSYLFPSDATHFHNTYKIACDAHSSAYYPQFKAWADRYFAIPHREHERRGLGGIFFDDLAGDAEDTFAFARTCGEAFVPAYVPIVSRRLGMPFGEQEKRWQGLRRVRSSVFCLSQADGGCRASTSSSTSSTTGGRRSGSRRPVRGSRASS
jgi:coproporphyrinogen III oxidase